jgi:glycosyltransferase involved in cell wall biosynthesis
MKNPAAYLFFRRWLRKEGVAVVHAHRSLALLFGYFSLPGRSGPALVVNRGTTYPLPNRIVRYVYRSQRLGRVIAVAEAVREALVSEEGIDPDRISVVYGSFDEDRFHPGVSGASVRAELGLPERAPLVVNVAPVDRRKGLHILIRAAAEVVREMPEATFLIAGESYDPRYLRDLETELDRLGLRDQVIFTGHRNDIPEILAAADLSVTPSTEGEGMTGAVREALAMARPVVCTGVCGNTELVRDGETGWVVEPGDPMALADAMVEALKNPDEAGRRAKLGRRRTRLLCGSETRVARVEEIYRELMQKSPR